MCGVTVIVVPADSKPANDVVATVSEALMLVNGSSSTLLRVADVLSLNSIRGVAITRLLRMAVNVSEAMITTAAGLLLAIPALLVYYYLRGRVLRVTSLVESQASEFVELIMRNQKA